MKFWKAKESRDELKLREEVIREKKISYSYFYKYV